MTTPRYSLLITPSALAAALQDKHRALNIRIIDATWFMPNVARSGRDEFLAGPRIKAAAGFWDVDAIADEHKLGLKHMMPSAELFAKECGRLGINNASEVIVYDTHGIFSSPRTLFTFKAYGHEKATLLDGGLPRWISEGYEIEKGSITQPFTATTYQPKVLDGSLIRSYEQIVHNARADASNPATEFVLDARSRERFTGKAPEPRPGLSSGHMPNSLSLPFTDLVSSPSSTEPSYKTLKSSHELRNILLSAVGSEQALEDVIHGRKKVVNSCGSGMTAAVVWLALQELGVNSAIYDESWTGYAMRSESRILQGDDGR